MNKSVRLIITIIFSILSLLSYAQEDYEWGSLPLGGGGFVSSVVAHPTEANLFYARTDVGGLYRWVESTKSWKPLTDWISMGDRGYYGIDAVALDPQNPAKVYALAGLSYFSDGRTVIMISDDYGETFTTVDVTSQFKTHGNAEGRHTGEKLAVDPTNSQIIYCGTRYDGLFKSIDGGSSWSKVSSLSVSGTSVAGVSFVQFDSQNNKIYVGLSKTSNNIWVSTNGGSNWTDISPTSGYYPHRAAVSNGVLYVAFASDYQSNMSSHNGKVYKYSGSWSDITPASGHNYGGISVVGNRLLVSTTGDWSSQIWSSTGNTAWGDWIYVSDDLGSSWTDLFGSSKVTMDANGNPWVVDHAMHWTGSAMLDPNNSNRAFFTSGNGIFCTENLSTSSNITLKFMCSGLEETVPLDLTNPSSGGIISAIGDYDGATYVPNSDNGYDIPSAVHSPEYGSNYGVDISADGSLAVRLVKTSPYLLYSTNKGVSWTGCSSNQGGSAENGGVAVSADGSYIVYCPGGSSSFYYSSNNGSSWSQCNGVSISGGYPVSDKVNTKKFYAANGSNVYYSTDGGKNWSQGGSVSTTYYKIRAVPGVEGDVWVPCGDNGLYRSTNSASSFSKISSVTSCISVGFGKAADGKTFPSVYIWGKVSGVEGLFRSIDGGSSWVRINDDAHQYGGPGNSLSVIGDMGVYGTVFMGTVGRGVIYGKLASAQCAAPEFEQTTIDICGIDYPTLDSKTTTNTNVTYSWYKDESLISGAISPTYTISAVGVYKVVRDSADCSHNASVIVTAELPSIDLGDDADLCASTSVEFNAGVSGTGYSYQWKKDGTEIADAVAQKYKANSAGVYTCVLSAENCGDVSDNVTLTSSLLNVDVVSACKDGGEATLTVTDDGGPYEWYSAQTGGTALSAGTVYSPVISENTTYYVQDAGGTEYTIGSTDLNTSGGWNVDDFSGKTSKLVLTVTQPCTLASIWVYAVYEYSIPTVTVSLIDSTTKEVKYTYTSGNITKETLQEIPVNFALTAGVYILSFEGSSSGLFLQTVGASYPYGYDGYVSVSNYESWATEYVSHCYKMKIKIGSTCVRTPAIATIDSELICADEESPVLSGTISVSDLVQNAMTLSWSSATDNTGVTGYEVYVNDVKSTTISASIDLSDLTCETDYDVKVRAYDAAGNYSEYITETFTTIGTDKPEATTEINYIVGDVATALVATGSNLTWYDDSKQVLLSTPIPSTTVVDTITYYVTQTINNCESDFVEITVIVATNTEEQTIALEEGWNLISIYVEPADSKIETIFAGLDVDIIKNNDGFYKSGLAADLQSLKEIQAGEGYLVKMNSAGNLLVEGIPLKSYTANLVSGWNLIGVPQSTAKNISDLPAGISIIKDFDEFYSTDDSGTMTQLKQGKGYFINVPSSMSIVW